MRDKHLHIPQDSELLRHLRQEVLKYLEVDTGRTKFSIWLKFVFYLSLSTVTYFLLLLIEHPVQFILYFVLYGFFILLLAFNFAHDLSHDTIFRNPRWNNLGFILIYTINGAHAEAWKKRHIESHHFAPNVEHYDSDLEISNLIRVIPNSPRRWFHYLQHVYAPLLYATYSIYWVFVKDFYLFFREESVTLRYWVSFWAQKLFYVAYLIVVPILFSHQPWQIVLLGFVIMHLLQSLFLLFTFFMTHHVEGLEYPSVSNEGTIGTSWVMNQIKSSNDIYPFSRFANFLFGGFNNHIAHHLFPHLHHIHYPKVSRVLYRILNERGIEPNQTTYWGGIKSHLRLLKRRGKLL